MVTTPIFSRPRKWTWSGARFVREKAGEVGSENQKRSLRYKRARFYSAQLGRFISRDPLGFVDGTSLYRAYFVPSGLDPTGRSIWGVVIPCGAAGIKECETVCAEQGLVATSCVCKQHSRPGVSWQGIGMYRWKTATPKCREPNKNCNKCTPQEHAWREAAKDLACRGAGMPRAGDNCATLAAKFLKNTACAAAQRHVSRCFKKPDKKHKDIADKHEVWAADAITRYFDKDCPPHPSLPNPNLPPGPVIG